MQQGVMEYHHPGVGTIVEPTGWVQCTHVHVVYEHVVYGYVNSKGHFGTTVGGGVGGGR